MSYRSLTAIVICGALLALAGCSNSSGPANPGPAAKPAAGTAANPAPGPVAGPVTVNVPQAESSLRVSLDGQRAEENGKGIPGEFVVKNAVSPSPKLRFDIAKPEKLGRIQMIVVGIFQQSGTGSTQNAEYTVASAEPNNPRAQMRAGAVYDLGNPGKDIKVFDSKGNEVKNLKLQPGKKYKLAVTVKADKTEMAQVEFRTR